MNTKNRDKTIRRAILCSVANLFLLGSLASCEGYACSNGTVMDKASNLALDSVFCKVQETKETQVTDSTGKFDLCGKFGSCVSKCKDVTIEFSKSGYKTVVKINPGIDAMIYLEK